MGRARGGTSYKGEMVLIAIVKKTKHTETMTNLICRGELSNIPSAGNVTGVGCEQMYLG